MEFWSLVLICVSLVPLAMIAVGLHMMKNASKKINWQSGYRTKRSMKNQETWEYAHRHFGTLWWECGMVMLVSAFLVMALFRNRSHHVIEAVGGIICILQGMVLVGALFPTENALKRKFGV